MNGEENWMYGSNRFDSGFGNALEVAVFMFTLVNMGIEIYDYYSANQVHMPNSQQSKTLHKAQSIRKRTIAG